jgi:hypothetical protein
MQLIKDSMDTLQAVKVMYPAFEADRDCPDWIEQEREYIASLRSEPKAEQAKIEYLTAVEQLEWAE